MDNFFFRKCMPYLVQCVESSIIVKNRYYEEIFQCSKPISFNQKKFLKSFSDIYDSSRPNDGYLYDDGSSPVANIDGFDQGKMNLYLERLNRLIFSMRGFEHIS